MKCFMTTDHPNAGPFTRYPTVTSWLMSKKARDAKLDTLHKWVPERTTLAGISRELDALRDRGDDEGGPG